jgi:hypothetical protein
MIRAVKRLSLASVVLAFLLASHPHGARGHNPWGILAEFESVAAGRVDESAVAAILFNPRDELFALVVFPAICDRAECVLSDPGAFLVLDREGAVVRLHIEPGREAISQPIFASVLEGFAIA